jgi:ribonuclease D
MHDKSRPDEDAEQDFPFRVAITKEEINRLHLFRFGGMIQLIREDVSYAEAVQELQAVSVLGFDTETRPAFRRGESYAPSLVQLAGENCVYVFQLARLGSMAPLFGLLADPHILKVGVATDHDVRQLRAMQDFQAAGFLNLETMTDRLGIRNNGLRSLCAIVLGFRISKGEQRSNWSRDPLTDKQLNYAATDAWVSREIYLKLAAALADSEGTQTGLNYVSIPSDRT